MRAVTVTALLSALVTAGCVTDAAPAPGPTAVPIATWVAQGIPGGTFIRFSYVSPLMGVRNSGQIAADGSTIYTNGAPGSPHFVMIKVQLSNEALTRILLAFEEKHFFKTTAAIGADGVWCVSDSAVPTPRGARRGSLMDAPFTSISIRINGLSKSIGYEPCPYADSSYTEPAETNMWALLKLLGDALKALPPADPDWDRRAGGCADC